MLLFNSNRSNKGKKYLKKDKVDEVYAEKAIGFNDWFTDEQNTMLRYLKDRRYYDSDVFTETYLKMYDNILFSGLDVDCYKAYFIRSYFTILMASRERQNRFREMLPNYDKADIETEYFAELEEKHNRLEADIFDYIYKHYKLRDFELFKMYVSLKPAVNYASLADITGIKTHVIQHIVSKIKKDIRRHHDFSARRREISA